MTEIKPICIGCNKRPNEIAEYRVYAKEDKLTPDEWVKECEGTYNPTNGHFYCTDCYIKAGSPIGIAP